MSYRSRRAAAPLHEGQRIPLPEDQIVELIAGVCAGPCPFVAAVDMAGAWKTFGPRIVATCITDDPACDSPGADFKPWFPPSTRPWAYWFFQHPGVMTMHAEDSWAPDVVARRLDLLEAHGDLLPNERERTEAHMQARGLTLWTTTATG